MYDLWPWEIDSYSFDMREKSNNEYSMNEWHAPTHILHRVRSLRINNRTLGGQDCLVLSLKAVSHIKDIMDFLATTVPRRRLQGC